MNEIKVEVTGAGPKADHHEVVALTEFFLDKMKEYVGEKPTTMLALFMAVHNFHKLVVMDIAQIWQKGNQPVDQTYRLADMTFRQSMKDLSTPGSRKKRRQSKPVSAIVPSVK